MAESQLEAFPMPSRSPTGFDAFWQIWPRKVARIAAERAWKGAIKRAPQAVIIAGAQAYADSLGNTEPKFILHASTFLNQDRWEDYHCDKVPQSYESPERKMWRTRLRGYKPGGYWPQMWGPRPGETDFQGPKDLEAEAIQSAKA